MAQMAQSSLCRRLLVIFYKFFSPARVAFRAALADSIFVHTKVHTIAGLALGAPTLAS